MDKRADIKPGVTPPEDPNVKAASIDSLADDAAKRAADAVTERIMKRANEAIAANEVIPFKIIQPR